MVKALAAGLLQFSEECGLDSRKQLGINAKHTHSMAQ